MASPKVSGSPLSASPSLPCSPFSALEHFVLLFPAISDKEMRAWLCQPMHKFALCPSEGRCAFL